MPDWITHILVAWMSCRILGFKFRQFDGENTAIAMVGSLIPDIVKIGVPFEYLNINVYGYITPIHMPVGSLILAAILSLFFKDKKIVFLFLIFGILTHFGLDLLLTYINGGVYLFYPLSWNTYQLGLLSTVGYNVTIIAILLALIVFIVSKWVEKRDKDLNNI